MKESGFKTQLKLLELNNQSTFFDLEGNRLEPKSRVKDAFPSVNNLIRLSLRSNIIEKKYYNGDRENIHSNMIEALRNMKMEFSIAIDGLGRQEFIKMFLSKEPKEEEEEEKRDFLQKMADMIG